ncbi:uncharacterized protein LOC141537108 isoform X2 [Cotesia typhae]|uniref:uncharacterized protein LOC141537108 isoform X2 n=1 Tax=Cotesia typhae TaxID=2053667 RepID=UPI003D6929A3
MDHVIHLENAYCGPNTKSNTGNFLRAEIIINKQTIVENLREFDEKNCTADEDEQTDLQLIGLDQIENSILPWRFRNDEVTFLVDKMGDLEKIDEAPKPLSWLLNGTKRIYVKNIENPSKRLKY